MYIIFMKSLPVASPYRCIREGNQEGADACANKKDEAIARQYELLNAGIEIENAQKKQNTLIDIGFFESVDEFLRAAQIAEDQIPGMSQKFRNLGFQQPLHICQADLHISSNVVGLPIGTALAILGLVKEVDVHH
jgi:hypothetical protein